MQGADDIAPGDGPSLFMGSCGPLDRLRSLTLIVNHLVGNGLDYAWQPLSRRMHAELGIGDMDQRRARGWRAIVLGELARGLENGPLRLQPDVFRLGGSGQA